MVVLVASAAAAAVPAPATASGECVVLVGGPTECDSVPVCVGGVGAQVHYRFWLLPAGGGLYPLGLAAGAGTHACGAGPVGPPSQIG